MKFHFAGKYDGNPDSLITNTTITNGIKFKEIDDAKKCGLVANGIGLCIGLILGVIAYIRSREFIHIESFWTVLLLICPLFLIIPHEFLHALCFKEDVYMYSNVKSGIVFVIGPETMSKNRFVFLSLFPNLVFGIIPFIIGMIHPEWWVLLWFGVVNIPSGGGDYYNVWNALRQMPKGSRCYWKGFNSYWYIPNQ